MRLKPHVHTGGSINVSQTVPNKVGENCTTIGGRDQNRLVGRELQFVKSSMQSMSDWRMEVDKRLSSTVSDISSMNKKIDLILRLQVSEARTGTMSLEDEGGILTSIIGVLTSDLLPSHAH